MLVHLNDIFKDRDLEKDIPNMLLPGITVEGLKDILSGKKIVKDLEIMMILAAVFDVIYDKSNIPHTTLDPKYHKSFSALKPYLGPNVRLYKSFITPWQ